MGVCIRAKFVKAALVALMEAEQAKNEETRDETRCAILSQKPLRLSVNMATQEDKVMRRVRVLRTQLKAQLKGQPCVAK